MRRLEQQRADTVRRAVESPKRRHRHLHGTFDVRRLRGIDQHRRGAEFGTEHVERRCVARRQHQSRTLGVQLRREHRTDAAGGTEDEMNGSCHAVQMIRSAAQFQ